MAKIPTDLSGRDVRRALERAGFVFRRQRGSHMVLGAGRGLSEGTGLRQCQDTKSAG
jgi:hypothetical protein